MKIQKKSRDFKMRQITNQFLNQTIKSLKSTFRANESPYHLDNAKFKMSKKVNQFNTKVDENSKIFGIN